MSALTALHSALRRNLSLLERALIAAGFTYLLHGLFTTYPVYPLYWDTVLLLVVFVLLLVSPVAGYFVLVAAAAYPLLNISVYLAVLVLAVSLIGQHWFIPNLGLILLTLLTPTLSGGYLAWLAPLLGGLWWGAWGGFLAGAGSALWGKFIAGFAEISPDWMSLFGILPTLPSLTERFSNLNSLETINLLFLPLMPDSTAVLYHLLQIGGWAFAGWMVGELTAKDWAQYRRPRTTIAFAALGALGLALLHSIAAFWLQPGLPAPVWQNLLLTALVSALAAMLAEAASDFLEHPWVFHWQPNFDSLAFWRKPQQTPSIPAEQAEVLIPPFQNPEMDVESEFDLPTPSKGDKPEKDGLIMIELD